MDPAGHLATSRDILGCHNWSGGSATGLRGQKPRTWQNIPRYTGRASPQRINHRGAEVEKPCSRTNNLSAHELRSGVIKDIWARNAMGSPGYSLTHSETFCIKIPSILKPFDIRKSQEGVGKGGGRDEDCSVPPHQAYQLWGLRRRQATPGYQVGNGWDMQSADKGRTQSYLEKRRPLPPSVSLPCDLFKFASTRCTHVGNYMERSVAFNPGLRVQYFCSRLTCVHRFIEGVLRQPTL